MSGFDSIDDYLRIFASPERPVSDGGAEALVAFLVFTCVEERIAERVPGEKVARILSGAGFIVRPAADLAGINLH